MAQFISIAVTSEGTQYISAEEVTLVEQASTTTVVVNYRSAATPADILTITHSAIGGSAYSVRDAVQDALVSAHSPSTRPDAVVEVSLPTGVTVSGIAVA
jgi:hypothetical protein